ncbi:DUF982 domain-containing protein [Sinorhizobium numidicum]|uniref:DUF982 domain-containing protein n=1 Tax=Sinorhizobium numidicum TaxID=680248 RepID=A0ABY8CV20_9HYPH|nr:DUF982 domain-containing protein [Sinorhizobium numidicum]WEX75104.1 DUF982 domain-containing protein [Sinorhizobium numidicum]WEX81098.1 DUF982 domain-containing protein [Sinorhizobium numidicum]
MANVRFDRAVYIQRKHFIDEITDLDEVLDYLESWPKERRDLSYDTLLKACRDSAGGRFPLSAVRENFRRFVKKAGMLAEM